MAAILPNDDKVSFGNISLLAGLLAISLRASTCLSAITLSSVPELIIAWLTFIIASASALAICSIALALPSASSNWDSLKPSALLILACFSASAANILACFSPSAF